MRVMDLTERIEKEIPREQALDWDNVGLLVGDKEQEIHKGYVALDLTDAVLEHAIDCGADMILTHHPLIFGGIKRVNAGGSWHWHSTALLIMPCIPILMSVSWARSRQSS